MWSFWYKNQLHSSNIDRVIVNRSFVVVTSIFVASHAIPLLLGHTGTSNRLRTTCNTTHQSRKSCIAERFVPTDNESAIVTAAVAVGLINCLTSLVTLITLIYTVVMYRCLFELSVNWNYIIVKIRTQLTQTRLFRCIVTCVLKRWSRSRVLIISKFGEYTCPRPAL